MGDAKSWLKSHREPGERHLDEVRTLDAPPSTEQLSGALLEAMRGNNRDLLVQLLKLALSRLPGTLVEDSLTAAWRRAHAQGLPLSKEMRWSAVGIMVKLRYDLTRQKKKKEGKPLGWPAVWGLVDRLQDDSKKLLDVLGRNVEEVDEVVELARRTALGIRAVKRYFYGAYGEVTWEEMEYLVALFVEAQTLFVSWAFVLASAETVNTHLKYFLEKLEGLRSRCQNKTDGEDTMKKKGLPGGERGEKMAKLVTTDKSLAGLVEDFALHRDWRSLQEISEALEVAIKALGLSEEDWKKWGWLALRRGLFLAGEKMKNSWTSPNLSGRYTSLLELMAPEGVLKVLRKGIRDTQAHGGDAAAELTMTREERERLQEELERVLRTARALLREAEVDLATKTRERTRLSHLEVMRFMASVASEEGNDSIDNLINARVIEILENATVHNGNELDVLRSTLNSKSHNGRILEILLNYGSRTQNAIDHTEKFYQYASRHCPQCLPTIHRLLYWKSSENLRSFKDDMLKDVDSSTKAARLPQYSAVVRALKHIAANATDIDFKVQYHAVQGGLQALASLWSRDDDDAPPLLHHRVPTLYGRQLRDYLHHGDSIKEICSRATAASTPIVTVELGALWSLICDDIISGEHGAEPRAADDVGTDEVLLLVQRKDDMFNKARLGDLAGLQRAAESGVDISSRDCWGRTLLHAAAEAGSAHVVEWLLELGTDAVDPRAKDGEGQSALHCAASGEVAELLLQPCKQVERDAAKLTPLHTAALSGREDVIRALIPHLDQDLNAENNNGSTPLHSAAIGGHEAAARLLLEAGAQYCANKQELTPLYAAAQSGSDPTVRLLLYPPPPLLPLASADDCWGAAGVAGLLRHVEAFRTLVAELQQRGALEDCPEARQAVGKVALGGSAEVAGELLHRWPEAVRLELDDEGITVLGVAALLGHAGLVRALLARGADPLHRDKLSRTALHYAAQNGHVEVISALWDFMKGEAAGREELRRLWSGQGEGDPPLCLAAHQGHLPAVQRLVELGADMNTGRLEQERANMTPLWAAARYGRAEVVGWLLEKGARLYPPGAAETPLHKAALFGHLDVVQLLVPSSVPTKEQRGVRLDLLQHADSEGYTALQCSVISGSQLLVELLLQRELDLLLPHHDKMVKMGKSPVWKSLTVYKEDNKQRTPLHYCVLYDAPPGVFDALLKHMEDERVMRLGGKDVSAVCRIVQGALDKVEEFRAASRAEYGHTPNSRRMKKQLNKSLQRLRKREQRASADPTAAGAGSAQPE